MQGIFRGAARLGVLIGALTAASCATLNEAECQAGQWGRIGFADGANGQTLSRLNDHAEACSRFGITPDATVWRDGYEDGLDTYCTESNGLEIGVRGGTYRGVCVGPRGAAFVPAYQDGLQYYEVADTLDDAEDDLDDAERDADRLRDEIRDVEAQLAAPGADVNALNERLNTLNFELGRAQERASSLYWVVRDLEREVDTARGWLLGRYPGWRGY